MTASPLVSVVIPVKDGATTIGKPTKSKQWMSE